MGLFLRGFFQAACVYFGQRCAFGVCSGGVQTNETLRYFCELFGWKAGRRLLKTQGSERRIQKGWTGLEYRSQDYDEWKGDGKRGGRVCGNIF